MTQEHPEETFARILTVCSHSGYRRQGIQKRIQENKNFLMCIANAGNELQACPWFSDAVRSIGEFFQEIHAIITISNAFDIHDTLKKLINACGEYGQHLRTFQNTDRLLLLIIKSVPCISEKIGFAESWIEDDELFFEDFRHATEQFFKTRTEKEFIYPWVGRTYGEFLLFNPS